MREVEVFTEGAIILPYEGLDSETVQRLSGEILDLTETDNVAVSVILSDNEFIQNINYGFRGKNRPTDVISFAYRDEPFPVSGDALEELGDIYISLEKAKEQASEFGVTFLDEIKRLLIHGMLHLLGYEHEKDREDAKKMSLLEEKLITLLK